MKIYGGVEFIYYFKYIFTSPSGLVLKIFAVAKPL